MSSNLIERTASTLIDVDVDHRKEGGSDVNKGTTREGFKVAFALVGATVILSGLILGGWQAGWWFTKHNVNREAHVIRNSYGNQQTLRDQITAKLGDVTGLDSQIAANPSDVVQLKAQRHAVANIVCQDAEQVSGDPLPIDQAQWISTNCVMGSAK